MPWSLNQKEPGRKLPGLRCGRLANPRRAYTRTWGWVACLAKSTSSRLRKNVSWGLHSAQLAGDKSHTEKRGWTWGGKRRSAGWQTFNLGPVRVSLVLETFLKSSRVTRLWLTVDVHVFIFSVMHVKMFTVTLMDGPTCKMTTGNLEMTALRAGSKNQVTPQPREGSACHCFPLTAREVFPPDQGNV